MMHYIYIKKFPLGKNNWIALVFPKNILKNRETQ